MIECHVQTDLDKGDGPWRSNPQQQRADSNDASTTSMSWILQTKKCVHVDEGQMQTGAVAEEQVARYPHLARLVREIEGTCNDDQRYTVVYINTD